MNHEVTSFIGGTNPLANGPVSEWRSQIEGLVGGVAATVAFPSALHYSGKFWDVYSHYNILDQLANGFGSDTGNYRFRPSP
jgi:hypothetical protein